MGKSNKKPGQNFAQYLKQKQKQRTYNEVNVTVRLAEVAALIAANRVLHLGKGRAVGFINEYRSIVNEIADLAVEVDSEYTYAKIESAIRPILGENFDDWVSGLYKYNA